MDMTLLLNVMMARAEKEAVAKFKRQKRKATKEFRKLKGRNTRSIKNKLCEKLGAERLQPRRMSFVQKAVYDYMQQLNKLPKCIRDQIDA